MKYTGRRILKAIGNRTGLTKLICTLLELEKAPRKGYPLKTDKMFGVFNDSYGNSIKLYTGLRDRLKPAWETMVNPVNTVIPIYSEAYRKQKMKNHLVALTRIENFLQTFSLSFVDKEILEIGVSDGSTAYAFATLGAKRVVGTDIAAYHINETPGGVVTEEAIASKNLELERVRDAFSQVVDKKAAKRVSFIEDNICNSTVASESVDVVVSWEVLEHISDPNQAFKEMARIVKPGGFVFHEYNPFFSADGGHSLCTLDFPWGHARLDDKDFERYYDEIRPNEKGVSLSFFRNNLNRMTLAHLKESVEQNGLRIVSIIPWYSAEDQAVLTNEMLQQCKNIHPTAELVDLIAPIVWLLCEKK